MSEQGMAPIPTVEQVVQRVISDAPEGEGVTEPLVAALIEREDRIADFLRVAGSQLGTFPELVAKVLADVGLGTPVDAATKALLDQQFMERVEWINEQFRRQQGGL